MSTEIETLIDIIIHDRAVEQHGNLCANPNGCSEWHIRNDYIPRVRREVIAGMEEAIKRLQQREGAGS